MIENFFLQPKFKLLDILEAASVHTKALGTGCSVNYSHQLFMYTFNTRHTRSQDPPWPHHMPTFHSCVSSLVISKSLPSGPRVVCFLHSSRLLSVLKRRERKRTGTFFVFVLWWHFLVVERKLLVFEIYWKFGTSKKSWEFEFLKFFRNRKNFLFFFK